MMGKHRSNVEGEQQSQAYSEGQQSAMAAPAPPAAAPTPSAGVSSSDVSRLQELGKLHEQGVLTDEEFARQKTLILGG
jgi:hypothetical protein